MAVTVKIEGLAKAQARLNLEIRKIQGDISRGLQKVGLDCLGKAVLDAPVDHGDLRGSGYATFGNTLIAKGQADGTVKKVKTDSTHASTVEIGFSTPYAVRQHEELEWNHPRGGKAKYLEDVVKRHTDYWVQLIRNEAQVKER